MPARVEYRLGSIFDEECDLLVIPVSAQGTVMGWLGDEMSTHGIPLPARAPRPAELSVITSPNVRFGGVGYAVLMRRGGLRGKDLEDFGQMLGAAVLHRKLLSAAMPLVGNSTAGISPREAVEALQRGFAETAPDSATLVVSVRSRSTFSELEVERSRLPPVENRAAIRDPDDVIDIMALLRHSMGAIDENQRMASQPQPRRVRGKPPRAPDPSERVRVGSASSRRRSRKRSRIFISYSHKDAKWLDRLQPHLAHLQDDALVWSDKDIDPGADWRSEIERNLASAKVAVLLVSAHFLASRFIRENELPPLLDAADREGATIMPVIISASRFDRIPELSRFRAVNDPQQPLMKFRGNRLELELDRIARKIEDALRR